MCFVLRVWESIAVAVPSESWSLVGLVVAMSVGAAGATYAYLFKNKAKGSLTINHVIDVNHQTVPIKDGSGARRSAFLKDDTLRKYLHEDAQTLYHIFRRGARESNNGPALGYRKKMPDGSEPYVWINYDEAIQRAENFAAGLITLAASVDDQNFIGIYSQNRPEWVIAEQACYVHSNVVVTLYDTLGPAACVFIINKMAMSIIVIDDNKKAACLLEKAGECPKLKTLIIMEAPSQEIEDKAKSLGLSIKSFTEVEQLGSHLSPAPKQKPPNPETLATVCFTSGTTGTPKGVMLTHGNIAADTSPFEQFQYINFTVGDTMISYLPLAHMFERILQAVMYGNGSRVGFFRGDIKLLTEDIKELKPTFVPAVPRLLNRIYDKVMGEVMKSRVKKWLMNWALASKSKELKRFTIRNNSIWDMLVFKKVREGMGGRVKLIICGSAPCSANVLEFMRAALGCIVAEGYGQTECVAAASCTIEGDHATEQVGPPVPCCMIKLVDVPDMEYYAENGKGEICVKGNNVSPGYYQDEEKTRETFDPDGWLHTGDIGTWTEQGTLKIIDRKKHIFKLAQGEYISPEKIENVYTNSKYVAQAFVYGESLKSCVIGVMVLDPDVMKELAHKEFGFKKGADMADICANAAVKKAVLEDITKIGKAGGLFSFEQVKDIHLHHELFTVENDLLTPTMKSKRPDLAKYFKTQLAQMYSRIE